MAQNTVYGLFCIDRIRSDAREAGALVCAAVLGAIVWNLITWVAGIPSSSSHALIGGLMGPFVMKYGFSVINGRGILLSVLLPLFISPIIGFAFGFAVFRFTERLLGGRCVRVKKLFRWMQTVACVLVNAFQGSNDAQKNMSIFALLLMMQTGTYRFSLPNNIILISALTIASGLLLGGMRMIKNVGTKIYSVKLLHSMSAQVSSLIVIGSASFLGFPVSGTQIVNSAVFGVGTADCPNAVGWLYARDMLTAWFITIPAAFLIASGFYWVFHWIGG